MLTIPVFCAVVTASGLSCTAAATEPAASMEPWVLGVLELQGNGDQDPVTKPAEQDDPIAALRKELMATGVEARIGREHAVGGLLLRKEPRAHAILQDVLRQPEDPDGLKPYILNELESSWAQTAGPVFGDESNLRLELIKSYARVIVRLIQVSNRDQLSDEQKMIEKEVLACLRDSIRPLERTQVFTFLLDGAGSEVDPIQRTAAMFAVAGCRDVSLIPLVAEFLDDPVLGESARVALQEQLITSEPFANKREFEAWWELNKNKTYIELIEHVARVNKSKVIAVRDQSVRDLEASRLQILQYAAQVEDWAQLSSLFEEVGTATGEIPELYLRVLRDALAQKTGLPGGDPVGRAALVSEFGEMLDRSRVSHRALILEDLALLVTPEDREVYESVQERLRKTLHSDQSDEAMAALKSIERFYSVENRRSVVIASEGYFSSRNLPLLEAGLDCLNAREWRAPVEGDLDRSLWVSLIGDVFAAEDLAPEIKNSGIVLAGKAAETEDTSRAIFSLLIDDVLSDRQQPPLVRSFALDNLPDFLKKGLRDREDAYLKAVIRLFSDPDVDMRKRSTEALKPQHFANLPDKQRTDWATDIVGAAVLQFEQETNPEVLEGLVDLLLQMNREIGEANVVGRLRILAEVLAREPEDAGKQPRREALVKGLSILGGESGIQLSQWVPAGEALLLLGEWAPLRTMLNGQKVGSLTLDPAAPVFTAEAFELVINAARLRPSSRAWSPEEAIELEVAFAELDRDPNLESRAYDNQESRLLRLRALRSRAENDQVVKLGAQYLVDIAVAFDPVQEVQARLLLCAAFVAIGNLVEAAGMLENISGQDAAGIEALAQWMDIAKLYRKNENWDAALEILETRFSAEGSPLFPEAFLLQMDSRLQRDSAQKKEIHALLMSQEALFKSPDTAEALRKEYEMLIKRASDTN